MDIPFDLLYIVASFITKPRMKLLDWIPEDKLNWIWLSSNSNAIQLLEKYPDKIIWVILSKNPSIFEIDTEQMKIKLTKKAKNIDYV